MKSIENRIDIITDYINKYGEDSLLTPAEVLELTEIQSPTMLKYYADMCAEYIRYTKTTGGHRRYIAKYLPVLLRIKELCQDEGRSLSVAKGALKVEGFEVAVEYDEPVESGLANGGIPIAGAGTDPVAIYYHMFGEMSRQFAEVLRKNSDDNLQLREYIKDQNRAQGKVLDERHEELVKLAIEENARINELENSNEELRKQIEALEIANQALLERLDVVVEQTQPKKHWWNRK